MKAKSLWIVLAFVSCVNAGRCPKVCVLDDVPCVTKGASNVYKLVVDGKPASLEPLDPYHLESLEGVRGSSKYTLRNIELKGLKDCLFKEVRLNATEDEYENHLHCPKLASTFNYEMNKTSVSPGQNKTFTVRASDYEIESTGHYGVLVTEKDRQPHFFIRPGLSRTYLEGELTYDVEDLCDAVHESKETIEDNNQKETVECLFSIIVRRAVTKVIAGLDTYYGTHLMGEVFPAQVHKPW